MTPESWFAHAAEAMVGKTVTDRLLASNSLSISIDRLSHGGRGWTVWFDPTWRITGPGGLLAGSRQAQDEDNETGWLAVTRAIDALVGLSVESLVVSDPVRDLTLSLSNGYRVQTFCADPRDDMQWYIRDLETNTHLRGAPAEISFGQSPQDDRLAGE